MLSATSLASNLHHRTSLPAELLWGVSKTASEWCSWCYNFLLVGQSGG